MLASSCTPQRHLRVTWPRNAGAFYFGRRDLRLSSRRAQQFRPFGILDEEEDEDEDPADREGG
jgi:hypothetical protein